MKQNVTDYIAQISAQEVLNSALNVIETEKTDQVDRVLSDSQNKQKIFKEKLQKLNSLIVDVKENKPELDKKLQEINFLEGLVDKYKSAKDEEEVESRVSEIEREAEREVESGSEKDLEQGEVVLSDKGTDTGRNEDLIAELENQKEKIVKEYREYTGNIKTELDNVGIKIVSDISSILKLMGSATGEEEKNQPVISYEKDHNELLVEAKEVRKVLKDIIKKEEIKRQEAIIQLKDMVLQNEEGIMQNAIKTKFDKNLNSYPESLRNEIRKCNAEKDEIFLLSLLKLSEVFDYAKECMTPQNLVKELNLNKVRLEHIASLCKYKKELLNMIKDRETSSDKDNIKNSQADESKYRESRKTKDYLKRISIAIEKNDTESLDIIKNEMMEDMSKDISKIEQGIPKLDCLNIIVDGINRGSKEQNYIHMYS